MYKCGWNGCEKAYGTLNHLNAHVTMQAHGQKRTPEGKSPLLVNYSGYFVMDELYITASAEANDEKTAVSSQTCIKGVVQFVAEDAGHLIISWVSIVERLPAGSWFAWLLMLCLLPRWLA